MISAVTPLYKSCIILTKLILAICALYQNQMEFRIINRPGYDMLMLCEGNTELGNITFDDNIIYTCNVNSKYRGAGLGRLLFDKCIKMLKERGVKRVKLYILGGLENGPMLSLVLKYNCKMEGNLVVIDL